MKSNTNIINSQVGDFKNTILTFPSEEASVILGKWGMLQKDYLFNHKKVVFATLLTEGKLYQHCAEVENQAQQVFNTLVEQMKVAEVVTEQLKEENQMEWVQKTNLFNISAREIVENEIL